MQTFLAYPDFKLSLQILDVKRLGKQRLEALQILKMITPHYTIDETLKFFPSKEMRIFKHGWKNHPAVLMWIGYENALALYYNISLEVWKDRGYKQTMLQATICNGKDIIMPDWFGNDEFHASHRSNLLRKKKEFYNQYGWTEKDDLEYVWPVRGTTESLLKTRIVIE